VRRCTEAFVFLDLIWQVRPVTALTPLRLMAGGVLLGPATGQQVTAN